MHCLGPSYLLAHLEKHTHSTRCCLTYTPSQARCGQAARKVHSYPREAHEALLVRCLSSDPKSISLSSSRTVPQQSVDLLFTG